jgi:alpha-ketoglutarate-dependent taurine dioxygenase
MTTTVKTGLNVTELKPNIGSAIHAGKEALLSGDHADEIRNLLEQRGVLVFPRIDFTDDEQLRFTQTLGTVVRERTGEEVFTVSLDPEKSTGVEYLKGSLYWHFDGTMQEVPILSSILCAKVISPTGGNTEFASTYAAYEALPDEKKAELEGLTAMHSAWNSMFYYDPEPDQAKLDMFMDVGDIELPLVWTHKSGRKSLVLGCTASNIVDMDYKQSVRLLNGLREWATSEPFRYVHEWSVGDMVMWDNTGTLHRATPYPLDSGREMRRTKLEGEEPIRA